ncbi:MAG: hypothetical protein FWE14_03685 [Lachnospiraceae bacterium]|nr:hypothetical protein [Lachnospiraceae bacterium]
MIEIIFVTGLVIQLLIGLLARNEAGEKKFLLKSAQFLYRKYFKHLLERTGALIRIDKNIGNLNPGKDKELLSMQYYIEKIRFSYAMILAGNILALILSISISQNSHLIEGFRILRNNWEQGSYPLELSVTAENPESKKYDITITVEAVSLNEEEVKKLAAEVSGKLPALILGKNISLSQVTENLNLITKLNDYPFNINWVSDKPLLIRNNGVIDNQGLKASLGMEPGSGEIVKLTAHLTYQDQWVEYQFSEDIFVNILPYLIAEIDSWEEAVIAAVAKSQQENADNDYFNLPEKIRGTAVNWQEVKSKDGLYLWLIIFTAAIIAFAIRDQELQKKVTLRNRQIDRDYPELVRKLALYLGAGMTLRGAWKRVAGDYDKGRGSTFGSGFTLGKGKTIHVNGFALGKGKAAGKVRYLYEEMLYSVRELDNGIPEREVYERFGKRVGIAKYRKLTGLLYNHLEKGNKNLLQVLREEAEIALEDRKKAARAIGEEMSTKLLLPMMMMLLIVMIMIMVPAFQML